MGKFPNLSFPFHNIGENNSYFIGLLGGIKTIMYEIHSMELEKNTAWYIRKIQWVLEVIIIWLQIIVLIRLLNIFIC